MYFKQIVLWKYEAPVYCIREFFQSFGNMTHSHEIRNFLGVLLKIGIMYMTEILQWFNEKKE